MPCRLLARSSRYQRCPKHPKLNLGRWLLRTNAKYQARIVNDTGVTLVLRNKFRDVWEDIRFKVADGESVLVSWSPQQVYEKLGAFVEASDGKLLPTCPRILISITDIAHYKDIVISYSKTKGRYSVDATAKEEQKTDALS